MSIWNTALAGAAAGSITGLFGAGGGMVLVPLLTLLTDWEQEDIFPASVSIILPICIVTLISYSQQGSLPWQAAIPYLIGSTAGGVIAGLIGKRIPVIWLHRILGIFIVYGGWRYLC